VHGAGVLPGRRIDQHRLQAAGLGGGPSGRLFPLGDREDRQIHVHDKAQEHGNAANDRHQFQEDEGEIIHVMRVIAAPPILRQILGSL
jgi:hypothetical protein